MIDFYFQKNRITSFELNKDNIPVIDTDYGITELRYETVELSKFFLKDLKKFEYDETIYYK